MLDPVHNQGLRLCLGAFRTSLVESLYVDAHELCLSVDVRSSMFPASRITMIPKHPTHDAVFDNKYLRLFDARLNVFLMHFIIPEVIWQCQGWGHDSSPYI